MLSIATQCLWKQHRFSVDEGKEKAKSGVRVPRRFIVL